MCWPAGRGATALLVLALSSHAAGAVADPERLRDGGFAEWREGMPAAWVIEVGATTGPGPASRVAPADGGGLRLEGDEGTRVWRLARQSFPATADKVYRFALEARAADLRRQPGGFDNCWAGLAFFDAAGNRLDLRVAEVRAAAWVPDLVVARAPAGTATAAPTVFLSMPGRLEVRALSAREVEPAESFALLAEDLARHYSYFALRDVEPATWIRRHRDRVEPAATDPTAFLAAVRPMLAELRDLHVFLVTPGGERVPTWTDQVRDNFDLGAVAQRLREPRQLGRIGLAGRTEDGIAYLAVASLAGDDAPYRELEGVLETLLDAPAFVLDLRANGGGSEIRAQRIAACFTDERRVYARSRVRAGPDPKDFADGPERAIEPRAGRRFAGPLACLIGPRCMSSGEGFAKMIRALPHAILIGQPTRGASGNPAPIDLPNGITVWYSRWVDQLPDGTVVEGRGITPDVVVPHEQGGDSAFEAALAELKKRLK